MNNDGSNGSLPCYIVKCQIAGQLHAWGRSDGDQVPQWIHSLQLPDLCCQASTNTLSQRHCFGAQHTFFIQHSFVLTVAKLVRRMV